MIEPLGKFQPSEAFKEQVTIPPGESKQALFDAWAGAKTIGPRCCGHHRRTLLIEGKRGIWKIIKNEGYFSGARYIETTYEPSVFEFVVQLECLACRCEHASCPPEFHETSFDTFDTSTQIRANLLALCRAFSAQVNDHGRGFALFVGLPGTGKTRLACNIVRELKARDALYVRQGTLTVELRASYGRKDVYVHKRERRDDEDEEEAPTLLEILQQVGFLVLDEIGCNPLANDERLLLDELLKHRFDHGKPTILLSNLALNGFQEFLGDALYDRIRQASGGGKFILQFQGDSYRRTTGEGYFQRQP
jgi:DNA replication protein DnaC